MAQQILSTNTFTTAKWIVSATSSDGTHTTIAAALTSASSGDTIFIRPGTYTENITLKAGVDLTAYGSDSSLNGTGEVIISGTCTMTTAGSVTISGIQLQTNSAALLAVTGSVASIVNLKNCYLNCTNTTGITYSSSSSSSGVNIFECNGNLGTTGISYLSMSSTGNCIFENCSLTNTGASTTVTTCSAGTLYFRYSVFNSPISSTGTGQLLGQYTIIDTSAQNVISLTVAGSGNGNCFGCTFRSGSAAAVSVSATYTLSLCSVDSTNTNPLTGAGTLAYPGISFASSGNGINVTTPALRAFNGGEYEGRAFNTAPSAGMLGEQIRSFVATAGVALTTNVAANVTSISLTAGIWDVSAIVGFITTGVATATRVSINTTSATLGTIGDNYANSSGVPVAGVADYAAFIPQYRIALSSTTTVYLVASITFSPNTSSAYGRISAVRVA